MLSERARTLWAKMARDGDSWLPLTVHMADAAGMAWKLWNHWLPRGVQLLVADALGEKVPLKTAEQLFVFLTAGHDLGKATPAFQSRGKELGCAVLDAKLSLPALADPRAVSHALASQYLLARHLGFDISVAIVAGGHHGKPPNYGELEKVEGRKGHTGCADPAWRAVQEELAAYAAALAEATLDGLRTAKVTVPGQVILSALVIMADWLASDETLFSLFPLNQFDAADPDERIARAWETLRLPPPWEIPSDGLMSAEMFLTRFGDRLDKLRPVQKAVVEAFPNIEKPGLAVIEAPMGEGKTETALAAAEIFAGKTGRSGVYFALPTQATSDGLFPRLKAWMERLDRADGAYGLLLAHGKARFNEEYRGIPVVRPRVDGDDDPDDRVDEGVVAHEWFAGRKRALLSGFAVGTIDQLLMAGLAHKHLALRHLGLANKVVILDECHAYDAYMSQYLFKALRWLGAYDVPVIVLSATLPGAKRREIVDAYLNRRPSVTPAVAWKNIPATAAATPEWASNLHYPLVTYTDEGAISQLTPAVDRRGRTVALEPLDEDGLPGRLAEDLRDGGCAGVIVNTVARAQALARLLSERMGPENVRLLHSRFLACDRAERERNVRRLLGPPDGTTRRPERLVVVGTQVMEQSLDVDFDVLFSDLCPIDLLIQRIGRLHRHERPRPPGLAAARCFVLGLEDGEVFKRSTKVYGEWTLLAARELVRQHTTLTLPDDIADWVNRAYTAEEVVAPEDQRERFREARRKHKQEIADRQTRARQFQIADPQDHCGHLTGWLSVTAQDNASGKMAEATVRDTSSSLEVLVVERRRDGSWGLLPWIEGGRTLPAAGLDESLAAVVAACAVSLPRALAAPRRLRSTIEKLERDNLRRLPAAWQESTWLRGELFLVLEREGAELAARLGDQRLVYDREYGLLATREEGTA